MGNYKGQFRSLKNTLYTVKLITDSSDGEYTEVEMAAEEPFSVDYSASETPFDAVRTSTATIKFVHNTYLEDALPTKPHDTQVILYNEDTGENEWVGWLTPKVYDQDYRDEYETLDLEAADCVSSLQYFDYTNEGSSKALVTFHSILSQICDTGGLDGFVWAKSKQVGGEYLYPTDLKISEQNFYSSDTDEPWKLDEVLDEMCKYIGMTAIEWKGRLYLADYQAFHNSDTLIGTEYLKSASYSKGSDVAMGSTYTITAEKYMASNATISFKPVYNKVTVNDSFYDAEYFIPNIFDDQYLTNRIDEDNFYANYQVQTEAPDTAQFPKKLRVKNSAFKDEDAADSDYTYFHRLYNHRFWESVYHNEYGGETAPSEETQRTQSILRNYMGGTIVDLGTVQNEYLSEYQQRIVPNKLDYTRYLCLCCKYCEENYSYYASTPTPKYDGPFYMFKLKSGYSSPCVLSDNSYLIISYSMLWERYKYRCYINPDWKTDEVGVGTLQTGGTLRQIGNLRFILRIGDKYWNGSEWKENPRKVPEFGIVCERSSKNFDVWNTELSVLNNVTWDIYVNETGYKIPLAGVDTTLPVEFIVLRPSPQFAWNSGNDKYHTEFEWNAYCWVKDLSIKCVQGGQDSDQEDSDVVYENIIDSQSINELDEIALKFTTYTEMTKPAYSNVIYYNGTTNKLLETITEPALADSTAQKPEENIIEKYVEQYNKPTKQFSIPLDLTVSPFDKIFYADVKNGTQGYCVLGSSIDYTMDTQTLTLEEKK